MLVERVAVETRQVSLFLLTAQLLLFPLMFGEVKLHQDLVVRGDLLILRELRKSVKLFKESPFII